MSNDCCCQGLLKFGSSGGRGSTSSILRREGALKFLPDNTALTPKDKYNIESKILGEGAFGSVNKATAKGNNTNVVALKTIKKSMIPNIKAFVNEVEINAALDHPNIAKLYETFEDKSSVYLAIELCNGGEIFDQITSEMGQHGFGEKDVASIMVQILRAVFHCHTKQVAHRDLKPENFLLQDKVTKDKTLENNVLKVIDFGIAKRFDKISLDRSISLGVGTTVPMKTKAGTAYYLAPEIFTGSYDEKVDVWSAGVILYILLCGSPPFGGGDEDNDDDIYKAAKSGKYTFAIPEFKDVSEEAKNCIRKMLVLRPADRVSVEQALNDNWITTRNLSGQHSRRRDSVDQSLVRKFRNFSAASKFKKAALHVIAHRLDDHKIKMLKEAFIQMDANGDGELTQDEVKAGCEQAGLTDQKEIIRIFQQLDADNSGSVGYTEFLAGMIEQQDSLIDENICQEAFRIFDKDNSGSISLAELSEMIEDQGTSAVMGPENSKQEILEIFKNADTDGDGEISFKEFMAMMKSQ